MHLSVQCDILCNCCSSVPITYQRRKTLVVYCHSWQTAEATKHQIISQPCVNVAERQINFMFTCHKSYLFLCLLTDPPAAGCSPPGVHRPLTDPLAAGRGPPWVRRPLTNPWLLAVVPQGSVRRPQFENSWHKWHGPESEIGRCSRRTASTRPRWWGTTSDPAVDPHVTRVPANSYNTHRTTLTTHTLTTHPHQAHQWPIHTTAVITTMTNTNINVSLTRLSH